MPIPYSVSAFPNPQKPDEPYKFYARSQTRNTLKLNKLADEISDGRTLTSVEIYGVIRALIRAIKQHLANGDCIDLDDLGKFRYVISSEPAESKKAYNETYIKDVRLKFYPAAYIKPNIEDMKFEEVLPVKIQKEAARKYNKK